MSAANARDVVLNALAAAKAAGADQADSALVESDSLEARVRGETVDFVKQARERTLGIRALIRADGGMRSAVTSTSDLAPAAVERLAAETVALARATAGDPSAGLPEGGFASEDDRPDLGLAPHDEGDASVDARIDAARRAEAAARAADPRIQNSEGSQVGSDRSRVVYANSEGFVGDYDSTSHSLFSEPIARENGAMQRDYWMTVGRRLDALEAPEDVGRHAALRALRRLGSRRVETCEVPVLFDALTAPSLIRQLAGCLSGYAIYRQASFLAGRLDEAIAAPGISVIDDGRLPGGLGSRPFDGEGLPTRRNVLVDGGRLASYLLDSYSARKLGSASTGNATRSAGSAPGVGPTNLWLEPGQGSLEDLIASTPRGLLVTELIGMGFNPVTGDYSRGAAGLWIEDGQVAFPVEEITIAGNFGDMLRDIDAVGAELLWLSRVAAPPLRVARMTVAGA
jgi:PmbA protein